MRLQIFDSLDDLPRHYLRMLEVVGAHNMFQSLGWFRNLLENTRNPGDRLRIYGVETQEAPASALAFFVALDRRNPSAFPKPATLEEFYNFYTLETGPIVSPEAERIEDVIDFLVQGISAETPRWDIVQFGSINRPSPVFDALCTSLRRHGMTIEPFFRHGNWYEDIAGRTLEQYINSRGKAAKETLRKSRKLDREHDTDWSVVTGTERMERAVAAYWTIYEESWKEPEIYPRFMPRLFDVCADDGSFRLGILYVDGEPAAAQLVTMYGRNAVMFKTAYVPKFAKHSSGAIVMARMLRHLICEDRIARIDFGAGDEPYKAHWASQRRERWGIVARNTRTPLGAVLGATNQARSWAKTAVRAARRVPPRDTP